MTSNITPVSSIQKLTKLCPEIIAQIQTMKGLRPQRDNTSGEIMIIVTHDDHPSKTCTIKILGLNVSGRPVVELGLVNGVFANSEIRELSLAYESIKSFFVSMGDAIMNRMPREFNLKNLTDHRSGGLVGSIHVPGLDLDVVFNCAKMSPSELEKIPCDYRMVGDSIWEKCVGISNLINIVDSLNDTINSTSKPFVPCKTPSSVPLSSIPSVTNNNNNDSRMYGNPTPKPPVTLPGGPTLRMTNSNDTRTAAPLNLNPPSTQKTNSKLDINDDSIEGFYNKLSPNDQTILKNIQRCDDFDEFKDKFCKNNNTLTNFVDKFYDFGIEITKELLMYAGCC